jgi:hypothetical protein
MRNKSPWVRDWWVYECEGLGAKNLGPGSFGLDAVYDDNGTILFYQVTRVNEAMPACWLGARLFARGSRPEITHHKVLPKWSSKTREDWQKEAKSIMNAIKCDHCVVDPGIFRLEGDLYPTKDADALTLVRIEGGVDNGDDILIVILTGAIIVVQQDGTAHGGGGPPG